MAEQLVTVRQIASEANVTDRTVRRWIVDEEIPTFVRGNDRRILIDRAAIEHHITPRQVVRGANHDTLEVGA